MQSGGRPRPGGTWGPPPRAPDVSPPANVPVPGPGAPRPSLPDATAPRPPPDVTPAPVPAPVTTPSQPRPPGADGVDVPRNPGVDAPDLPPGQRPTGNPSGPDAPPGRVGDAAPGAPNPTLTQRARNGAAGLVPSLGIGLGLTGLTMFIQQAGEAAQAGIGAAAGLAALEQLFDFLGEPVNLAIVAGVVVIILMPKS
jgi:hypothetical protein